MLTLFKKPAASIRRAERLICGPESAPFMGDSHVRAGRAVRGARARLGVDVLRSSVLSQCGRARCMESTHHHPRATGNPLAIS